MPTQIQTKRLRKSTQGEGEKLSAHCTGESGEESDGYDVDVDAGVWRLQRKLQKRQAGGRYVMPAVQAWTRPPGVKFHDCQQRCKELASSARKVFAEVGNSAFWISAQTAPRTPLEHYALDTFWFHAGRLGWTAKSIARLGHAAGAEIWIQRRSSSQPEGERGVGWHYDKDENLLDETGLFVQPLVATATYLTDRGAPLVVLTSPTLGSNGDGEPDMDTPELGPPQVKRDAFVAFPSTGLHVAFRGNLLHGVPPFLAKRKGERLSVLVNVWVKHRPLELWRCQIEDRKKAGQYTQLKSAPRPGRQASIRSLHPNTFSSQASSDFMSLTPDVGDWSLEGLWLPRDLHPEGLWRVAQKSLSVHRKHKELHNGRQKRKRN